jgi:UDP-3-O-[3-hydroxymyristoyl] glucosamine N-acyltransferase
MIEEPSIPLALSSIAAQAGIGGTTTIEEDVIIWGQVGITKDVVIGKGAMILAQSGVSKSLEGGKVYFCYPADENRKTLKEMANIRKIDSILQRLNQLEHKDEPFLD